ncbi:hypothetical protein SAMN05216490_3269 [Mucilaginibacter mallensis]|uniref:Uncharacterized protein n=1 Tax=Mucilaginibacter mallensis TaxID=652787 RepID=A0A1H1ZVL1_MUCMA|nr:hypothetical protein [Mucilaginibacter mallensis]SDT37815.1 hypothetical protein SAMN05216490_3269 [Mucilaginibacter mallensis]
MKGLPVNLFKTFIFSTILAIAANSIYYAYIQRNLTQDYQHAVPLITGGTFFLTIILTIMASPMLFLANINFWNIIWVRLLLYFSGTIVFIGTVIFMPLSIANKLFDLITGAIFILVHFFFYARTVKKAR